MNKRVETIPYKGEYSNLNTYNVSDSVSSGGTMYIVSKQVTDNIRLTIDITNTTYFNVLSKQEGDVTVVADPSMTNGSQKTQVVNNTGTPIAFATSTKQSDGTQKTQVVDATGTVIPPNGAVSKLTGTITRAAETNSYLAGDMVGTVQTLLNAAIGLGGGGFIMDVKVETDITQLAGCVLRFWLYTITPTGVVADNSPFVNSFANADKRCACGYFDVIIDVLLPGSDCVIGKYQPNTEYVCDPASKDLYTAIQTLSAITTPKSSGILKFSFNVVKIQ